MIEKGHRISFLANEKNASLIASNLLTQTYSNLAKPTQTYLNLHKLPQTYSNFPKLTQTYPNLL